MQILLKQVEEKLVKEVGVRTVIIKLHDEQGGMNDTYDLYADDKHWILQTVKYNGDITLDYVNALYETAGFFNDGMRLKIRTFYEKACLHNMCEKLKIPVPRLILCDDEFIIVEFIQGIEFHKFQNKIGVKRIKRLFDSLALAHKHNIVFGDRWAGNMMVSSDDIYFIDFDFEYCMPTESPQKVNSFELAVFIYDLLQYSCEKRDVVDFLRSYLRSSQFKEIYDTKAVEKFLLGYCFFYQNKDPKFIAPTSLPKERHIENAKLIKEVLLKI